ncbi:hypothetical protein [uncultured Caballeronia sp.]|jgi:hypothetical protein
MFQDGGEQLLLAAEIVVEHSLIRFGAAGYLVHTRPEQASRRELLGGGKQDSAARALRISFDFWLVHGGFMIDKPRFESSVMHSCVLKKHAMDRLRQRDWEYRPAVNLKRFDYVHIVGPLAIGIDWEQLEIRR